MKLGVVLVLSCNCFSRSATASQMSVKCSHEYQYIVMQGDRNSVSVVALQ
jgi:hypothetical protein